MVEIAKLIEKIAPRNLRVLITGEPGTEKEEVARLIHESSPRADLPFEVFHLSARVSPSEIKTKLFGKGEGSTVIDLKRTSGLLDKVRGGTLFLNHVEYFISDPEPLKSVEARIVAGSNPTKEILDFFSEAIIALPPLRERTTDIPLLAGHYLEKFSEKYGKEVKSISPEVEEIFSNYEWPGNTEELKCLLERLVIIVPSDRITADDLPIDLLLKGPGAPGKDYLSLFRKKYTTAQGRTCLPAGRLEPAT